MSYTSGLVCAALALCDGVKAQQQSARRAPTPPVGDLEPARYREAAEATQVSIARFREAQLRTEAAAKLPPPVDQGLDASSPPPLFVRAANGAFLTPAAAATGGFIADRSSRCNLGGGFGGLDINSAGMAIMQSSDEVIMAGDGAAGGGLFLREPRNAAAVANLADGDRLFGRQMAERGAGR